MERLLFALTFGEIDMADESKVLKLVKREEPREQTPSEIAVLFLEDVIKDIKANKLNILKLGLILMLDDPDNDGYNISYQDMCVNNLPEAIGLLECAKQVVLSSD